MRYAAALETGLADDDPIDVLTDQSGNGHDLADLKPANRALYKTAILNGWPVYRFSGDPYDTTTGPSITTGYSVLYVQQNPNSLTQQWYGAFVTDGIRLRTDGAGADGDELLTTQNTGGFVSDRSGANVVHATDFIAFLITYDGSNLVHYVVDMSTSSASVADTGNLGGGGTFVVGGDAGGTGGIGGTGSPVDVAEIVVWDHALDGTERSTLATYLNDAYGL